MTSLSGEGYFSNGVTSAVFIVVGTIPVDIDRLTVFVTVCKRQVNCSFSNQDVTGSNEHDFEGLLLISLLTSSFVAGTKKLSLSSTASGLSSGSCLGPALKVKFSWISRTLS